MLGAWPPGVPALGGDTWEVLGHQSDDLRRDSLSESWDFWVLGLPGNFHRKTRAKPHLALNFPSFTVIPPPKSVPAVAVYYMVM